jgi:hypothetical protein
MRQVIETLESKTTEFYEMTKAAAEHKHAAKRAMAMKLMEAKIGRKELTSDTLRSAWAYAEIGDAQLRADVAAGHADAQKEAIRSLHHEADLLRSLSRSARDMQESPGWGNGAR